MVKCFSLDKRKPEIYVISDRLVDCAVNDGLIPTLPGDEGKTDLVNEPHHQSRVPFLL